MNRKQISVRNKQSNAKQNDVKGGQNTVTENGLADVYLSTPSSEGRRW